MLLDKMRVVDPVLTQVAFDYRFPQNTGFALFPVVPHTSRGGKVTKFGKEAFILQNSQRALGAAAARVTRGSETVDLLMVDRSLENPVDDREWEEATEPNRRKLVLQTSRSVSLMNQIGLEVEAMQATLAQTSANYPSGNKNQLTGGAGHYYWSDYTNGDPITDILAAKAAVRSKIGKEPNVMHIAYDVWLKLRRHPKLLAEVPVSDVQVLTVKRVQDILEIPKIVIGESVYVTGKTADFSSIWTKTVILANVPDNPVSMDEPSFGLTARMTGYPKVDRYRDERSTSEIVRVQDCLGSVLVGSIAGYLIYDAIA